MECLFVWKVFYYRSVELYFQVFQTERTMMPFLCDHLEEVVRSLMLMFEIHENVNKAKFAGDLALTKLNKTKHQLPAASVKLLTATSRALRSADADEALKVQFTAECEQVLVAIL